MPVKIDPDIVDELREMDLAIWEAGYFKHDVLNEKTGKMTRRENKNWVHVTLAGPGVEQQQGTGKTLREAVDAVLVHKFADRVPGLRGAMMRCEIALHGCFMAAMELHYRIDPVGFMDDDCVPF